MQMQPPAEFTEEIKTLFVEKKLLEARERLLARLENNWNGLCNLIAFTYLYAENRSDEDSRNALVWLEKGIERDEVDAKVILGRLLVSGELGRQDFPRGLNLLEQAAQANVLMAVLTLFQIHQGGVEDLLEANPSLARAYQRQAADLGDPESAYHVALQLEQGVEADYTGALRYLEVAARGGLSQAIHNLGIYYLHGKGVSRNVHLALAYLTEAARLGSPLSLLSLALMHLEGNDMEANHGVALSWVYIYQTLFPQADIPAQLQALVDEATMEVQNHARAAAQNFLAFQLNKSPSGTLH